MKTINWIGACYVVWIFCSLTLWINFSQFQGALISPTSFHRVEGKIISVQIDEYRRRKWRPFNSGKAYSPEIKYQYKVGGIIYHSTRIDFDLPRSYSEKKWAQEHIGKYQFVKKVIVFYWPNQPSFSVLEPHKKGRTKVVLYIVVSLWIASLLIVVAHHFKQVKKWIKSGRAAIF